MRAPAAFLPPEIPYPWPPRYARFATSLLNGVSDSVWDCRLNIRTDAATRLVGGRLPQRSPAYATVFAVFDALALQADDVVVDVGARLGRLVCVAATYPIKEVIGLEPDGACAAIAQRNLLRLRGRRAAARIVSACATPFDFDAATVLVLVHPGGAQPLRELAQRIHRSLVRRPRSLRVVYINPCHAALLAAVPGLELYDAWHPATWTRLKQPVHFYCSTPATNGADENDVVSNRVEAARDA